MCEPIFKAFIGRTLQNVIGVLTGGRANICVHFVCSHRLLSFGHQVFPVNHVRVKLLCMVCSRLRIFRKLQLQVTDKLGLVIEESLLAFGCDVHHSL